MDEYPGEEVSYYRPATLPGVEVLAVEHSPRLWRLHHETYSICTVLDRGTRLMADWRYRGQDHVATECSLMMMEPGELHVTRRVTQPGSFRVLLIDSDVVCQVAQDRGCSMRGLSLRRPQTDETQLYSVFHALACRLECAGEPLDIQERFCTAIGMWLEHCMAAGEPRSSEPSQDAIKRAIAYVREKYAANVTLAELAAVAHVTREGVIRGFKKYLDRTPHQYLLDVRITRARNLMARGVPISDVATATGFCDQARFSHHFKERCGVTPGQYAKMMRLPRTIVVASTTTVARVNQQYQPM